MQIGLCFNWLVRSGVFILAVVGPAMVAVAIDVGTSPSFRQQEFEAWGVSLSWSGNLIGDYEPTKFDALVDRLFEPANHLGFTFTRYNIGGGQNPFLLGQMRPGGAVPGWVPDFVAEPEIPNTASWNWDWEADPRQRYTLDAAIDRGVRHTEAFILSAPYWMTITKDTAGGIDGGENLETQYYDEYAHYMTEVVRHFDQGLGIHFETLSPMNEANQAWWRVGGSQEGMHVPRGFNQRLLIEKAGESLLAKGLGTRISATDEFNASGSLANYQQLNAYTKSFISTVGTHVYGNNNSTSDLIALRNATAADGKRLIVSEYGNNDSSDLDGGIALANRITADLKNMHVDTWTMWQGVSWDNGSGWGLIRQDFFNPSSDHVIAKQYHVMRQFAANIRPGSHVLDVDDEETLAAYDPSRDTTTIVVSRDRGSTNRSFQLLDQTIEFARIIQTSTGDDYRSFGNTYSGNTFTQFIPEDSVTTLVIHHKPNLIRNSEFSFQAGQASGMESIDGWNATGDAAFYEFPWANLGLSSGQIGLHANVPNASGKVYQNGIGADRDLSGVAYEFSIDALFLNDVGNGDVYAADTQIGFEFLGADGRTMVHPSEDDFLTAIRPDVEDAVFRVFRTETVVAPPGTRFVRPVVRFTTGDAAGNQWTYLDNAYLQEVAFVPRGREWISDASGSIDDDTMWRLDTLNANNHHAYFGSAISANRSISIANATTFSGITFDNERSYTLVGSGTLRVGGSEVPGLIDSRQGNQRIATLTVAANDLVVRILDSSTLTLDKLDLAGFRLEKQGAGKLSLGFGFKMDGGTLSVDPTNTAGITISRNATLDGTLEVDLPIGFDISAGQSFVPIHFVNGVTIFSDLSLPPLDNGLIWESEYINNTFELRIVEIGGDFNGDGNYDCVDVDALTAVISQGTHAEVFDLDGNGLVDTDDLDQWLVIAGTTNSDVTGGGAFRLGDANLDGVVDVSDFNIWNANKFTASPAWCLADFTADGLIDVSDFNVWNANKFQASDATHSVPEPTTGFFIALASFFTMLRTRHRRLCY